MASVTGITDEYAEQELDKMIVDGQIDPDTGVLFLYPRNGDPISAGAVIAPTSAVEKAWPVGSIFISAVNTNPGTLLGIGSWNRFAKGRTLVSLDEAQTEFDQNGETGGAKTVTLTSAQSGLRAHDHGGVTGIESQNHTHIVGAHTHGIFFEWTTTASGTGSDYKVTDINNGTPSGGTNTRVQTDPSVAFASGTESQAHTHAIPGVAAADATAAHNNLQPYVVVYMWQRIS